ncbi:MAG: hypothetical protein NDJ90_06020 [Oligoflexia bacterium]|nr:hypothetical protein [Oligoflexia bacterium]
MKTPAVIRNSYYALLVLFAVWLALLGQPSRAPADRPLAPIGAIDLARMMVEGRRNFSVIDLTGSPEEFHLKGALKADLARDLTPQVLEFVGGNRGQAIILVGASEAQVRPLAAPLVKKRFRVLAVPGGIGEWKSQVLEPANGSPELMALSRYLQGKSAEGAAAATLQQVPPGGKVQRRARPSTGGGGGC